MKWITTIMMIVVIIHRPPNWVCFVCECDDDGDNEWNYPQLQAEESLFR